MKKLILLLSIFTFGVSYSQINYQAQYTNAGNPVINQSVNIGVSILDLTANGATIYSETHTATTNDSGVFTIVIGQGTVTIGELDLINWETDKYVSVTINGELQGVTQVMSVPVALYSKCSEKQKVRKVLTENVDYGISNNGSFNILELNINSDYANKLVTASFRTISNNGNLFNGDFQFGGNYGFLDNPGDFSSVVIYVMTEDGLFKIIL